MGRAPPSTYTGAAPPSVASLLYQKKKDSDANLFLPTVESRVAEDSIVTSRGGAVAVARSVGIWERKAGVGAQRLHGDGENLLYIPQFYIL
jgi:hypothetical protein